MLNSSAKRLFILGSGFSKAVFPDNMPTVTELAAFLQQQEALKSEPYVRLADDPELLLSYLSTEEPWKEPPEALEDEALFKRVQRILAEFISDCEERSFEDQIPKWTIDLVDQLHLRKVFVITLNYDTVLEQLASVLFRQDDKDTDDYSLTYSLYNLPLSSITSRVAGTFGPVEIQTFRLIKLHGSVNWYYSGGNGFPGEQVYLYVPTKRTISQQRKSRLTRDKIPLIIPPVAEKSRFYGNQTIRTLWTDARSGLEEAEEIFCVGYSLPATDLTTKLFLRSVAYPRKVIIVNKEPPDSEKGQEMLKRYREAFPGAEIDGRTFTGNGSVEKMTEYLINS